MGDLSIERILGVLGSALLVVFLLRGHWKRYRSPKVYSDEEVIEDPDLLSKAEQEVKNLDWKTEVHSKYDLLDSYSTVQGYSEDYMNQIVNVLEQNQIQAVFMFVDAGPVGMISITQRDGMFELYIQKNKAAEAMEIIKKFRAT